MLLKSCNFLLKRTKINKKRQGLAHLRNQNLSFFSVCLFLFKTCFQERIIFLIFDQSPRALTFQALLNDMGEKLEEQLDINP